MRRPVLATVLAAVTALLLVPAAHAGLPATVGEGQHPHVLVDDAGRGHVVWLDEATDVVHYCQLPALADPVAGGAPPAAPAPACTVRREIPVGTSGDAPYLVQGPSALYIAMPHYVNDETYLWTSNDGGQTWGPRTKIYDFGEAANSTEPIWGPQPGQITFAGWNPKSPVWSAAVDGSEAGVKAHADLPSGDGGYWTQVAPTEDGGLVATGDNLENSSYWRLPPGSDPSDLGSWSGETPIGPGGETRVAGGPGGTYLLSGTVGRQQIRPWTGTAFGSPVTVESEAGYINDVTVSSSGGAGAIWRVNDTTNAMRFGLSTDAGKTFGVSTIVREDTVMADMDVSLAGNNRGYVTFEGAVGADPQNSVIRVATTDPVEAVSPNPPAVKVKKAKIKGATLRLTVPGNCVAPGARVPTRVTWKRKKGKGNVFQRVRRVDFFMGGKRQKIDRKAPFSRALRIRNAKAGKTYTVKVRVFTKVKKGKAPKKTLRVTVRVCA